MKALLVALPAATLLNWVGACRPPGEGGCNERSGECPGSGEPVCGNGLVEGDEHCDTTVFDGESCKTLGDGLYTGGTLRCSNRCTFDVSQCISIAAPEVCDDGRDNDQDRLVDCDDADCAQDAACMGGTGGQPGSAGAGGAPQGMGGAADAGASGAINPSDGGAPQGMGGAGGEGSGSTDKLIYRTAMPKKANFGGISGADALCDADKPRPGIYKALLVDGATRRACTNPSCADGAAEHVDWVLAPDTAYARPDGTRIGTTNNVGIFVFPLEASIAFGYTYWTGLSADWTSNTDDCSDWTETVGYFANEGNGDAVTSDAIAGVNESCASLAGAFFVCVEQ